MKRTSLIAIGILFLFSTTAFAKGETKIGYVDLMKAIYATKEGKAAKEKLEKKVKKKQKELDKKLEEFKKLEEDLEKQISLMPDDTKKKKLKEYQEQGLAIQNDYMKSQKTLMDDQEKMFGPILTKMQNIINEIGLSEGYTIIFDKSAGIILYSMPHLDLTAKIIAEYNKSVK